MPRARPRRSTRLEPRAEIQQNQKQQQDKSEDSEELEENGAWWNVEAIINERVTRRKKEYLVSWEGLQDSGEPWPLEWVGEVTPELLKDWKKKKALAPQATQTLEPKRASKLGLSTASKRGLQLSGDSGKQDSSLQDSDPDDQSPRDFNHHRRTRAPATTRTRSRSESLSDSERPSKRVRTDIGGAPSEEPVPSIVSFSTLPETDAASLGSVDTDEYSHLECKKVTVELRKSEKFDTSEYRSLTNSQDSSVPLSALEEEDQRAVIASQLSQDIIPNSQDLPGHIWARQQSSTLASRPYQQPAPTESSDVVNEVTSNLIATQQQVHKHPEPDRDDDSIDSEPSYSSDAEEVPSPEPSEPPQEEGLDLPQDLDFQDTHSSPHDQDLQGQDTQVSHTLREQQPTEEDQNADRTQAFQVIEENQEPPDAQDLVASTDISESQELSEDQPQELQEEEDSLSNQVSGEDSQDRQVSSLDRTSQHHHTSAQKKGPNASESLNTGTSPQQTQPEGEPLSRRITISSLVIPDSQDLSLSSNVTDPTQDHFTPSPAGITSIQSQVEIIPDSVVARSDLPSHRPGRSETRISERLQSPGCSTDPNTKTRPLSEVVPISSEHQERESLPEFPAQPQAAFDPSGILSSLASQGTFASQNVDDSYEDNARSPNYQSHTGPLASLTKSPGVTSSSSQAAQVVSQHLEFPPAKIIDNHHTQASIGPVAKESSCRAGSEPLTRLQQHRTRRETSAPRHPASSAPARSSELGRSQPQSGQFTVQTCPGQSSSQDEPSESAAKPARWASRICKMDDRSASPSSSRRSAADELRGLFDFDSVTIISGLDESGNQDQAPKTLEEDKDQSLPTIDPGTHAVAAPALVVSSPELQIHTQPAYVVEPWKTQVLGNTQDVPSQSISPASIMANPHLTATDSIRDLVNMAFDGTGGSLTQSLLAQDSEDIPPGTVSPADISKSANPVDTTHTFTLSNQGAMASTTDESSGQSITMGQIPDQQTYRDSSASPPNDGIPLEHIVTLPFQASRRPKYDEILKAYKSDARALNEAFSGDIYQEPDQDSVKRVNDLFNRLLNICDYPQDLVGTELEDRPSSELARYACDANPKFNFLFELMATSQTKRINMLVVARTLELLRLIYALAEVRELDCRADSIGKSAVYGSSGSVIIALTDEDYDPTNFDVVIGYDHTFSSSAVSRRISTLGNDAEFPLVLLLVTTHSIEHIGLHISKDVSPLERKHALLSSIVLARRIVEDPDPGYGDPHEIAKVFTDYLNGYSDSIVWEPHPIPDNILDVFQNSQPRLQMSTSNNDLKRKRDDDEMDDEAKRMRVLPLTNLPVESNNPPLTLAVRQMLNDAELKGSKHEGRLSSHQVPSYRLESLASKMAEFKRQAADAVQLESYYKDMIHRLTSEVKDYQRTTNRTEKSYRAALQDRTKFQEDLRRFEATAKAATENVQKEKLKLQEQIAELNATVQRLRENEESAEKEDLLVEERRKNLDLAKKLEYMTKEHEYLKSRFQEANYRTNEIEAELRKLKESSEGIRLKASENVRQIHETQARHTIRNLQQENECLKVQLWQCMQDTARKDEELRIYRNGRSTRQSSIPRSPHMGFNSPRPGRAGFASSTSRGTSPASTPVLEGAGSGTAGMPFMGQQPGNGRGGPLERLRQE